MKRIVLMALLALALPLAAFAGSSVDFQNSDGTIYAIAGALTDVPDPSVLTAVNGYPSLASHISGTLGYVTFTTSPLSCALCYATGGTFNAGGSFVITGNGTDGLPNGTIFDGSFTGGSWKLSTLGDGTHQYTLNGDLTGTWESGSFKVYGITTQITVDTGTGYLGSCGVVSDVGADTACTVGGVSIASGDTDITVPEPGTLGLLGTGLVGVAGMVRRKLFGA